MGCPYLLLSTNLKLFLLPKIELLKKLAEDSKRACFEGPDQQEVQLYHFCPFILAIIFVLLLGLKFLWSDYHLEMHIFGTVGARALAERPKDFCQYDFLHGLWYHKILHESKMVSIIVLEYLAPLAGACQSLSAQWKGYRLRAKSARLITPPRPNFKTRIRHWWQSQGGIARVSCNPIYQGMNQKRRNIISHLPASLLSSWHCLISRFQLSQFLVLACCLLVV